MPPDAPPAPPAAPAAPETSPAMQSQDNAVLTDAFSDLDKYLTEGESGGADDLPPAEGASTDTQSSAGKSTVKSAGEKKEASTTTKPPAAPSETTKEKTGSAGSASKSDSKPEAEIPLEKMAPKQLREAHTKLKAQVRELEEKIKQAAEKSSQPADDPEKKTLLERLAERDKELASVREEMGFADFEKSTKYKEEYWKPFVTAFDAGRNRVASLTVTDGEGATRKGTKDDFDRLMKVTDDDTAAELANEMFGNKAAAVLYHRERVIEANARRVEAIEDFRRTAPERAKQREEQMIKHAQSFMQMNKEAAEKYPHWFKPTEGDSLDPKSNELLEKGMKLADMAFAANKLAPEEQVKLHSALRNKAGAFDRVAYELNKARKELKELRAELDEIKSTAPGEGTTRRKTAEKPGEMDWEARLNALARD